MAKKITAPTTMAAAMICIVRRRASKLACPAGRDMTDNPRGGPSVAGNQLQPGFDADGLPVVHHTGPQQRGRVELPRCPTTWRSLTSTLTSRCRGRAFSKVLTSFRSVAAYVLVEPRQIAFHHVQEQFGFGWRVRRPWVDDHLRHAALTPECVVQLVALRDRHALVFVAVKNQSGRPHALGV